MSLSKYKNIREHKEPIRNSNLLTCDNINVYEKSLQIKAKNKPIELSLVNQKTTLVLIYQI